MPLTSFDLTFDFTFARTVDSEVVFPPVGGDGGGGISGAVLPFSEDSNSLPSCMHPQGQGWERWRGVPIGLPDYLMPFVLAVPMPDNVLSSPYCTQPLRIVDADTGVVVLTPYNITLHRLGSGNTLYIVHSGSPLYSNASSPASLPTGNYRVIVGDAVSDVFGVRCGVCALFRIRLLNDTRIGDLLYGSYGFQQVFYVEGELSGPSYSVESTGSSGTKTMKKVWTLSIDNATEPVADALSLAEFHKLVEVSVVNGSGESVRSIQALEFSSTAKVSASGTGGFDIELTLPVRIS